MSSSQYKLYITTEQLLTTVKELHSMQKNTQYSCSCQAGSTSLLAKAEDVLQSRKVENRLIILVDHLLKPLILPYVV